MNLHKSPAEFRAAINGAAKLLELQDYIVEKDYWITFLLKRIAAFEYRDYVVFK